MSQVTRANSKLKFQTADVPSQADFEDLHDSVQWYDETNIATEYTPASLPSTPSAGVTPFSLKIGGDVALAWINALGEYYVAQPHWGLRRVQIIAGHESGAAVYTNVLSGNYLVTGGTSRTPLLGSVLSAATRIGYVTGAGAGSTAYIYCPAFYFRGNAAGQGGFEILSKIGLPTAASGTIWFHGMSATAVSSATTNVSTLTNKFGFCKDSGDTNVQFIYNDGAGSCTKVDTTIAISATTIYLIRLYCKPNDTNMYASLYDYENNLLFESGAISSNIPANTQSLLWQLFISNNATASAAATDLVQVTTITNH